MAKNLDFNPLLDYQRESPFLEALLDWCDSCCSCPDSAFCVGCSECVRS